LNDKNQLTALLLTVLLMFGQFSIIPFLSPSMVANVGFKEDDLKYIYLVGGLVTIFTSPLIGKWADKYGRYQMYTLFIFLTLIPLFLITNMPKVEIWQALLVTAFFFICIGGRMIPAQAMITSAVKTQNRGSFMGINSSIQHFQQGLHPIWLG
jgi:MFS transporter, DHA1 family, inner membrane transport protein